MTQWRRLTVSNDTRQYCMNQNNFVRRLASLFFIYTLLFTSIVNARPMPGPLALTADDAKLRRSIGSAAEDRRQARPHRPAFQLGKPQALAPRR